jgi:hypothetical protein
VATPRSRARTARGYRQKKPNVKSSTMKGDFFPLSESDSRDDAVRDKTCFRAGKRATSVFQPLKWRKFSALKLMLGREPNDMPDKFETPLVSSQRDCRCEVHK